MNPLMKPCIHVISVSGGKDSTATLLLALERVPRASLRAILSIRAMNMLRCTTIWPTWSRRWG